MSDGKSSAQRRHLSERNQLDLFRALSPIKHFAHDLRQIVHRQTLPGCRLIITHDPNGAERPNPAPTVIDPVAERSRKRGLVPNPAVNL